MRELWRRLMAWREELHRDAAAVGVDPDRYQVMRSPGENDGELTPIHFPKDDTQ